MTIDDMKNKISMELRSTDTQLGFEIICKKLMELEKENAELKKEIEKRSMYEKHIEYENEQLKEQIEKMKNCMNCDNGIVDDEDICDDCNSENCWKNWELAE